MSKRNRAPRPARAFGYVVAIVVNIVLWYIVHNLESLRLPYVLVEEFSRVMPALEMSLGATIIANACFIAFDPPFLRHGVQIVLNLLSANVLWAMHRAWPVDFGVGSVNSLMRWMFLLALLGVCVATVVELVKLVGGSED